MANPEHLKKLKEGVEEWNQWRNENPEVEPDLSGADLHDANLRKANLDEVDLIEVNFRRANLKKASLGGALLRRSDLAGAKLHECNLAAADLTRANLRRAELNGASFREATLRGADMSGADLSGADFAGADLSGANFGDARLDWADFTGSTMTFVTFASVDLSLARGLDSVVHLGPSTIGIDTVQNSGGAISEAFLKGAGVTDELIAFIRAMAGAIQFYSCFISYSSKDQLFAKRLYADLQTKGVRCWFAPHDVQAGKKLHEQIDVAIRRHERLLLILSPDSINSEWVKTEIIKACNREREEKRRVLFPVALKITYEELKKWECFDADAGKDLAREVREYYIPDFTEWEKAEKFKEELEKLVRDLKKAERAGK